MVPRLLLVVAACAAPRTAALQMRVLAQPAPQAMTSMAPRVPSPAVRPAGVSTVVAAPRAAAPVMSAAALLGAPPLLYVIISFYEYAIHRCRSLDLSLISLQSQQAQRLKRAADAINTGRSGPSRWFQHAEFNSDPTCQRVAKTLLRSDEAVLIKGGGHVEHHAETYDDMSLKFDERWRDSAPAQAKAHTARSPYLLGSARRRPHGLHGRDLASPVTPFGSRRLSPASFAGTRRLLASRCSTRIRTAALPSPGWCTRSSRGRCSR